MFNRIWNLEFGIWNLKIRKIIIYLFFALFIVTPLVMSSKTSEIFEYNKLMFVYLSALVITSLSILYLLYFKIEFQKKYRNYFIVLLVFFLLQFFSTLFSIDVHTSIFGYYGRWNGGLLSIIAYLLLLFAFIHIMDKKAVIRLLKLSLITSTVVMIWGLLARFGFDLSCLVFTGSATGSCWTAQFQPTVRMFSTLGQPNWLGAYLAIHFFIGLYFLHRALLPFQTQLRKFIVTIGILKHVQDDEKWRVNKGSVSVSLLYALYILLNALCIFFTGSRSSILAVVITLIIAGIIISRDYISRKIWNISIGLLIIILLITGYFVFTQPTKFDTSGREDLVITDSFDIRRIVWKGAVELGLNKPLLGTGLETFGYAYYFVRPVEHNLTSEWDFLYNKAHNEFLNYFANTGLVGFVIYLAFVVYSLRLFKLNYRQQNPLSFYLFLSYTTILTTNFFGFSTSTTQIFFYLLPAMAIVISNKKQLLELEELPLFLNWKKGISLLGLVLITSYCLIYLINYYRADLHYARYQRALYEDDYATAMTDLQRALNLKYEHLYADKMSTLLAQYAFLYSLDTEPEILNSYIQLSKKYNDEALNQSSKNILYWQSKGRNYYLYYQATKNFEDLQLAIQAMKIATTLAPTEPRNHYTLALFNYVAGQETADANQKNTYRNEAINIVNKTLQLKPDYVEAQELLQEIQ